MSRGGAMPMTNPAAWAYLSSGQCTIYWKRGDKVAYLFEGKQSETCPDEPLRAEVLATIPGLPQGWTGLAHVRLTGENWVKATRRRCHTCGARS
jgi:hypothetical protein